MNITRGRKGQSCREAQLLDKVVALCDFLCVSGWLCDFQGVGTVFTPSQRGDKSGRYLQLPVCGLFQETSFVVETFLARYLFTWNGHQHILQILQLVAKSRLVPFESECALVANHLESQQCPWSSFQ